MNKIYKRLSVVAGCMLLPLVAIAATAKSGDIEFRAQIVAVFEIALIATSIVSIWQFFFPGDTNRTPLHVFHILCVVVFYVFALGFLLHNKTYFEGYENLSDGEILKRYFTSTEWFILTKRIIYVGVIFNLLYIYRYGRGYFRNG